jgi:CRP-like cAMP-binding protein
VSAPESKALQDCLSVFAVTAESLDQIVSQFEAKAYPKGEHLLRAGEVGRYLWFIERGLVKHYTLSADGRERITCFFAEGSFIADLGGLHEGEVSRGYIEALEPTATLALEDGHYRALDATVPEWARLKAELLQLSYREIEASTQRRLELEPAEYYTYLQAHRPDLLSRVSQVTLAAYLGIAPQSLSRIRARRG